MEEPGDRNTVTMKSRQVEQDVPLGIEADTGPVAKAERGTAGWSRSMSGKPDPPGNGQITSP